MKMKIRGHVVTGQCQSVIKSNLSSQLKHEDVLLHV
jgi:hypothetical protein